MLIKEWFEIKFRVELGALTLVKVNFSPVISKVMLVNVVEVYWLLSSPVSQVASEN